MTWNSRDGQQGAKSNILFLFQKKGGRTWQIVLFAGKNILLSEKIRNGVVKDVKRNIETIKEEKNIQIKLVNIVGNYSLLKKILRISVVNNVTTNILKKIVLKENIK